MGSRTKTTPYQRISALLLVLSMLFVVSACLCSTEGFFAAPASGMTHSSNAIGAAADSSGDVPSPINDEEMPSSIQQYTSNTIFTGAPSQRYRQRVTHKTSPLNLDSLFVVSSASDNSVILRVVLTEERGVPVLTSLNHVKTTRKLE